MRDVFTIAKETTPADAYDALASILGKSSERVISRLNFIGEGRMFGQAVTLRSLPARPDLIQDIEERTKQAHGVADPLSHAISLCKEGSVLVIDASGYNHSAVAGGTKMSSLAARNAAGLVTDGSLRDKDEFSRFAKEYGMKTGTHGWTIQSGTKSTLYPGDINVPISIHGVLVRPGDYIFGDANAFLVIPEQSAEEVLELGVVHAKMNDFITAMLEKTKGILGHEVKPSDPTSMKLFLAEAQLSERQMELFKKYVSGDVA